MDTPGLRGERVRLLPLDLERHLEPAWRWSNDPEVHRFTGYRPRTLGQIRSQLERLARARDTIVWAIHDERDRPIGLSGLGVGGGINWPSRRARTFTVLGEKGVWGQGYGTDSMRLRSRYAFQTLGLNRLHAEVVAENVPSQRALENAGYVREGVARQRYWRDGRWQDGLIYAALADDHFGRQPAPAPEVRPDPETPAHRGPPLPPEDLPGLAGERVRLVGLRRDLHLENYLVWLNDPLVTRTLHQRTPLTRLAEEEWFEKLAEEDETSFVWAIHDEAGRHIGAAGLHQVDWRNRRAVSGMFIGDREAWGRGYGTEVARLRTRFAFQELGLHRVESETRADNPGIHRVLERVGYRREATLRQQSFREGRCVDFLAWGVLAENWEALERG